MTTLPRDGRGIYIHSIGLSESMYARIVRSVVCTPEPHASYEVPIVLDAGGLTLTQNKDGELIYESGRDAMVLALTMPFVAHADEIQPIATITDATKMATVAASIAGARCK